jgi:membrane dipeptidase
VIIVDAHQDLAWNMLTFGRDYTLSAQETRRVEAGSLASRVNGDTLLGWADYQRGKVALIFATLFASPIHHQQGEWDRMCYSDPQGAYQLLHAQKDAYQRLVDEHPGKFRLIATRADLQATLTGWEAALGSAAGEPEGVAIPNQPVGLVTLMEGAEAIREPQALEEWWAGDVRIIGPAWTGTRYSGGTGEPGPLSKDGFALLEAMAYLGFGLDLSHMDERAALQALDAYPGQVLASHSNANALLKGIDNNRHLSDRVIQGLIDRDGVIGIVAYNAFLKVGWKHGDPRQEVPLERVIAQIDYICQMAGDARHVGIGTDFDGGFGVQAAPAGIDTIADLQKLVPLLVERGYPQDDIAAILAGNWLEKLRRILPE